VKKTKPKMRENVRREKKEKEKKKRTIEFGKVTK
jgi:hypothetical protein